MAVAAAWCVVLAGVVSVRGEGPTEAPFAPQARAALWQMVTGTPTPRPEGDELQGIFRSCADSKDPMLSLLAEQVLALQGAPSAAARRQEKWTKAQEVASWYRAKERMRRATGMGEETEDNQALEMAMNQWAPEVGLGESSIHSAVDGGKPSVTTKEEDVADAYVGPAAPKGSGPTRWATSETPDPGRLPPQRWKQALDGIRPAGRTDIRADPALPPMQGISEFDGYDCTVPWEMQVVQTPQPEDCASPNQDSSLHQRQVAYELLQRADTLQVPVRRCLRLRTQLPLYCGNYDHQTVITSDIWIHRPVPVSEEECRRMWERSALDIKVRPSDDEVAAHTFPLTRNGTTQINYDSHGRTWFSSSTHVECQGVKWHSPSRGKTIHHVVQMVAETVTLSSDFVETSVDEELRIVAAAESLPRSCAFHLGRCQVASGTYVWNPPSPDTRCPTFRTRLLQGEEVTVMDHDRPVTIFNDDTNLVRLQVGEPTIQCGHHVRRTNFRELFLYEVNGGGANNVPSVFRRELPPYARNLALYVNQQSGWLHGRFTGRLRDYVQKILQQRCEAERQTEVLRYADMAARQGAMSDGETVALGGGYFATATGEAWRRYRCRPLVVYGVNKAGCYNALPVALPPAEARVISEALDPKNETKFHFFLEPGTRILSTTASEVPCSPHLAPLYQDRGGQWIQATPALLPARAPEVAGTPAATAGWESPPSMIIGPDFQLGGIYTKQQLRGMADFQRRRRDRQALLNQLVTLDHRFAHEAPDISGRLFAAAGIPDVGNILGVTTSWVWGLLSNYGTTLMTLLAFYIIYRLVAYCGRSCYRCTFPDNDHYSALLRFFGGLFPYGGRAYFDGFHREGRRRVRKRERRARHVYLELAQRQRVWGVNEGGPNSRGDTSQSRFLTPLPRPTAPVRPSHPTRPLSRTTSSPSLSERMGKAPLEPCGHQGPSPPRSVRSVGTTTKQRTLVSRRGTPVPLTFGALRDQLRQYKTSSVYENSPIAKPTPIRTAPAVPDIPSRPPAPGTGPKEGDDVAIVQLEEGGRPEV